MAQERRSPGEAGADGSGTQAVEQTLVVHRERYLIRADVVPAAQSDQKSQGMFSRNIRRR